VLEVTKSNTRYNIGITSENEQLQTIDRAYRPEKITYIGIDIQEDNLINQSIVIKGDNMKCTTADANNTTKKEYRNCGDIIKNYINKSPCNTNIKKPQKIKPNALCGTHELKYNNEDIIYNKRGNLPPSLLDFTNKVIDNGLEKIKKEKQNAKQQTQHKSPSSSLFQWLSQLICHPHLQEM
jgi:hypothetical protein